VAHRIAIGYGHEHAAALAAREVRRLAAEGVFAPAFVAAVARDRAGRYRAAGRRGLTATAAWGTLRGMVALGALTYRPLLGAMTAASAVGDLVGGRVRDRAFEQDVRDMLAPGTSVLLLVVDKVTPDEALEPLSRFGGTVLKSSLSREAEHELEDALHGPPARA
jgi:uncharacterized membrane protein